MAIRLRRTRLGLTAKQLGRKVGASKDTVLAWERERWLPRPAELRKLARVLGCAERALAREPKL